MTFMRGLYVEGEFVAERSYVRYDHNNKAVFDDYVLEKWHKKKLRIFCACQEHYRVEMHVRRIGKKGIYKYTLVNNKEQSDKHRLTCPFYGEVEHGARRSPAEPIPAVVREADKLIVRVNLFHGMDSPDDGSEKSLVDLKPAQAKSRSPSAGSGSTRERAHVHNFADFIYDWYKFALEMIQQEKKAPSRSDVLYHMWVCLIKHKIMVGSEDFYYKGYVVNPKFTNLRGFKVVVGWLRETEEVLGGQRWVLEGWGKVWIKALVKKDHIPRYPVIGKLAALRLDCNQAEYVSIAPAMAWRVTKEGWFLFSDAEWELLKKLREKRAIVARPLLWGETINGYVPDFYVSTDTRSESIFVDTLDDPSEKMEPRNRLIDELQFREARLSHRVLYVPWRSGDGVKFLE